ncbi:LOW QUALITY PROTEIN: annexin A6 [Scyliorhinus canicula]|uniref:LOW QUALITY PROTEIN: annexin A6 n=1 Tax=Scyliorhinus canicula TaxID=7830 RepID=UPI0018F73511|nr:LOW QUALITY PROTEIN: annexin A6 [Scyliorhinus canicula]
MSARGKGRTGYRGSVKDAPSFSANQDAEMLYNAMKGFGSDKETIIDLLTSRSNAQRQQICAGYKTLHGRDLIDDLKYELTGKFERLLVGLMKSPAVYDAKELRDAIKGLGTDENCVIEILASRNNKQIHELTKAYNEVYESDLETDIVGDTSGHFKKMLVVLLQGTREEDDIVSDDLVAADAKELYEAGELQWGTTESSFITILGNRSFCHLQSVFDEYQKIAGKEIEESLRGELSGDFEKLMLAVVRCARNTKEYFSDRLYKAMKGMGTRDNTLIRIMISRSEIDMFDIREEFRMKYEKSLHNMIRSDTSGDYKRALLRLCGGDDDAAGEFFPEAAQVAYQIWEVSAATRIELKGTVRPAPDFKPEEDAKALRKAMKGFGTDEETIINIIAQRNNAQRQQLRQQFKSQLGRDLMADLKSEVGGPLQKIILGLMMTPAQFDAKQLQKAIQGVGTDERALIEILTTRTNEEIRGINEAYKEAYHKSLEDSLSSDTSGHFKRLLISLIQGNREEGDADLPRAMEDAKLISDYLELCGSTDDDSGSMESKFISVLCMRSYRHLRRVFQDYIKLTNRDIEQTIKNEISGDLMNALIAIVRSIKNKPSFFAERLYKSMKGAGTDDRTLIRIMVSRSEIDLLNIRHEFKQMYDVSLYTFIEGDTSGDYSKVLLVICGGEE